MAKISFYKKIDKSSLFFGFVFGVTGNPYIKLFEGRKRLKPKEYRSIKILLNGKKYPAKIGSTGVRTFKGKKYPNAYRILYGSNDLVKEINKIFISSYIKIQSGKKLTKTNSEEVLEVTPLEDGVIRFKPYVQRKTDYDKLFEKFIDSDVFGWLYLKQKEQIFLKSPNEWISKNKLKEHKHIKYAIYYLIDTNNKQFYVGSATDLFSRLSGKRSEIPEWNKFRYDILRPDFHKFLEKIEHHTIRAFANLLTNKMKISSIDICEYTLMNKRKN